MAKFTPKTHFPMARLIFINKFFPLQIYGVVMKSHDMSHNARKPVFGGFANNTDADQPAHLHSLISTFVIRFLESNICTLATGEI